MDSAMETILLTAAAQDYIESFGRLLREKFGTRRIGMNGAAEHLDKELELLHRSVTCSSVTISDSFEATLSKLRE